MPEIIRTDRPTVRFEHGKVLLIAGMSERYTCETSAGIPSQWQRVVPHIGSIPGEVGKTAFGVRYNRDDEGNFDYLSGVEVSDFAALPPELAHVRISAQKYAVFSQQEHISTIRSTWATVWTTWLPASGHRTPRCA